MITTPQWDTTNNIYTCVWENLWKATKGDGIVSGFEINKDTTSNMVISIAAGSLVISNTLYSISDSAVTITSDSSYPKRDAVIYSVSAGLTVVEGTASTQAHMPQVEISQLVVCEVLVSAAITSLPTDTIYDRAPYSIYRVLIQAGLISTI